MSHISHDGKTNTVAVVHSLKLRSAGQMPNLIRVLDVHFNSLTTKKQTTKFSSANLKKIVKSKLCHTENLKTRGQTV